MNITPASINGLRWIVAREPVGFFDKSAPHKNVRTSLLVRQLIERVPSRNPKLKYELRLTEKGREVLIENGWL